MKRSAADTKNVNTADFIRESGDSSSLTFNVTPSIIAITRLKDGRIVDVNDNYLRFYNCTRKEALKQSFISDSRRLINTDLASFFKAPQKHGSVMDFKTTVSLKNEGERDVAFSANLVTLQGEEYVFVVILDITEQKRRQEFLYSVYDASPSAIFVLQGEKLKYTNRQFQAITGFSQAEMHDTDLLDIVFDTDKDVVRSNIVYTLKHQKPYPSEYRILHKNGRIKWVMQTAAVIHYEDGEAALGSLMDVTERKSLERRVIEYEELNKMKAGILATVSHELRTPLAAVKGYASMILDYYPRLKKEETIEYLISINNSADKLNDLVNNLIDASRMDSGLLELPMSPASITDLIRSTVRLTSLRIKDHNIVADLPTRLPRGLINIQRIKQVLENLINNAAKYSPEGTEIIVSALKKGNEIQISVADHGKAIPTSELKNIFDRMYKAEHRFYSGADGMGLGLHICWRLVEAHGGKIWAESAPDQGTIIRFTLPAVSGRKM